MSHYWTSDDAQEFRALQLADWIEDLAKFPAHHVATAVAEWRQTQSRRPTPADIIKIIGRIQQTSNARRLAGPSGITPERRAEFAAYEAEWKEKFRLGDKYRKSLARPIEP